MTAACPRAASPHRPSSPPSQARHSSYGIGISAALNGLVRRGLAPQEERQAFVQRTHRMGMRVDVRNVAEVLDTLDAASEH